MVNLVYMLMSTQFPLEYNVACSNKTIVMFRNSKKIQGTFTINCFNVLTCLVCVWLLNTYLVVVE